MTARRTYSVATVTEAVKTYGEISDLNPREWLMDEANVAVVTESGDVALFERASLASHIVAGHFFFKSRGKEALASAKEVLKEAFRANTEITMIVGLVPKDKKHVSAITRRLGFSYNGDVGPDNSPCEYFTLSKFDWENSLDG
jgi:hypothetical protein